jgi:replication factor C subunit 3/5
MSLLVDKYRPRKLSDLTIHPELTDKLLKISRVDNFPHLLIYGPNGAGKKTRVLALLVEIFGNDATKVKVKNKVFEIKVKSRNKDDYRVIPIEITVVVSNYHMEVTPSDVGQKDRFVVQEAIKEVAQTANASANARPFRVVVINEVDRLSLLAQQALRRTMEKYAVACRLILICESTCRVIAPLKSRCQLIRVSSPSEAQVCEILYRISDEEKINLPRVIAEKILVDSKRNMRQALLMLDSFRSTMTLSQTDWKKTTLEISQSVLEDQTAKCLLAIRPKLHSLLVKSIPPETILKTLIENIFKNVEDSVKSQIIECAAQFEYTMKRGTNPIFHLEAFIAKFMVIYKQWVIDSF